MTKCNVMWPPGWAPEAEKGHQGKAEEIKTTDGS